MPTHSRWIPGLLSLAAAISLRAEEPSAPAQARPASAPPVVQIVECMVYPEGAPQQKVDCTQRANAVCAGHSVCELPIGLDLTGGRQLGEARTWKKVRVRYRCGELDKVNGPHNQSDHATMLLGCVGGF
jgi:hypothetical protein